MSSTTPLVTVVITTYFRNDRLRKAINSVEQQEYDPIELIVVDGSGEKHAEPVASEYDISYFAQEQDGGAHAARNIGAQRAEGAFVNFLDDDDRLKPTKISKQVAFLREHDSVGVVYCGKVTEDGRQMMPDPAVRGHVLSNALKFEMTPSSPSTMLIRRDVLERILPLKHRHGADDMGMKIELARITEFDFIDEPLVIIGDSTESLGESIENIEGRKQILDTYSDLYEEFPPEVEQTARAYTHLMKAEILLNEKIWSPSALWNALVASYLIPGIRLSFVGYLCTTFFGRIGRDVGRRFYFRYLVGSQNRGKIT